MRSDIERVRQLGEALIEDEEREKCLAWRGLKAAPDLQRVYARHGAAIGDDALEKIRAHFREARGAHSEKSARRLLEWQVDAMCTRVAASLIEREHAWASSASIRTPDGNDVPYRDFSAVLARTATRNEREALYAARSELIERGLGPIRIEQIAVQRKAICRLGLADSWLHTWQFLSGIDITRLCTQANAYLQATSAVYDKLRADQLRELPDLAQGMASWIDLEDLVRGAAFDAGFPASALLERATQTLRGMGLDLLSGGRVTIDDVDRSTKDPVAMCFSIRIPEEVVIVTKPYGGHWDWSVFLHEMGHALHYSRSGGDLPFEDRRLGDDSVNEACAFLFQSLVSNQHWLRDFSGLDDAMRTRYLRFAAFLQHFFMRRYCAALLYETEVLRGTRDWSELVQLYVQLMSAATGFRYRAGGAFTDLDFRLLYRARYLRGWQLQALLSEELERRFGVTWWHSARATEWLDSELWIHGRRFDADELAARLTGRQLGFLSDAG